MCDPVTAIGVTAAVVKIGGAVVEHVAQNKNADAVKDSANAALALKDHELSIREVQERIAGSQQIDQGKRQTLDATGDVQASAAARGVGGMTVDLLLNDLTAQGARFTDSVNQNTNANVDQLEREKDAAKAEANSRIAGAPGANPFVTALKIGSAGLDYASTRINMSPKGV